MTDQFNPYRTLPAYTRWSKGISGVPFSDVDPVVKFPFSVSPTDLIATAGSCFAQHIARHLRNSGYKYFVKESGNAILRYSGGLPELYNYGTFSCRYGNIYTARQLLQLAQRAMGSFEPVEVAWDNGNGFYLDPFRPAIQPEGFISIDELLDDRRQHLHAVRTMFEELDVFVFTLGLTEHWYCREDGAVLPVCPGVAGGVFNSEKYSFGNQTVEDVVSDFENFLCILRTLNKKFKIILTVSPVPLAATAIDRHVLTSTTYSKSVLRVAAETIVSRNEEVGYFPSYEIITGNFNRGKYFSEKLRDVTEEGVQHVMRLFMKHVGLVDVAAAEYNNNAVANADEDVLRELEHVIETVCEEALLENAYLRNK